MKTFYIEHTGCPRRGIDAERVKDYLTVNGLGRVTSPKEADYVFLFTCGFCYNVSRSMEMISRFDKLGNELIVCGCLPSTKPEEIRRIFGGSMLETKNIDRIDDLFPDFSTKFKDVDDPGRILAPLFHNKKPIDRIKRGIRKLTLFNLAAPLNLLMGWHRPVYTDQGLYSIRISRGCTGNCSYCTIKKSIGGFRSKSPSLILKEIDRAIREGQYRINLIGADMGAYGRDIGTTLPDLLKDMLLRDRRFTIDIINDLNAVHVCRYKDELIELVGTGRIKRIRIGVQSGSERISRLMNRYIDFPKFKEAIRDIKRACRSVTLCAQIIAGFPTETAEEFSQTIMFIGDCGFDDCIVYAYYENEATDSAKIAPKVSPHIIEGRVRAAESAFKNPYVDINIDRTVGKIGIFLRNRYPGVYRRLKQGPMMEK